MECSNILHLFSMMSLFATVHSFTKHNIREAPTAGQSNATVAVKIGVILDLNGSDDNLVGRVGLSCIQMAVSDFYAARPNYTTRLDIHARDSSGDDVVQAASSVIGFRRRWKKKIYQEHPELNSYGLWAYDATTALAMAVENINTESGPTLARELSQTRFKGLSGDFVFEKGQLRASTYEMVNVIGNGVRRIGLWPSKHGLGKKNGPMIIWPGETTWAPKGFEIPTNGKKLRIGVPVKHEFFELVNVNNSSGIITGYCIDIFEAVVKALPYALPIEYVPFAKPNGESAGTYNDLVHNVFLGKFDGAVGDITIRAKRSLYVDFTFPYSESGVAMLVAVQENGSKNAWVFLNPLAWELWVTTFLFFVFIGFVIWVLEHRINNDFRGPPSHQAGTSFWFSFSTVVFAHREKVVSNLTRTVMIIWCFVVLILTQSYSANLTSLLTVQQLKPVIADINQLLRKGESVGFQRGSSLMGLLLRLGFENRNLVPYNSLDECHSLFSQRRIVAAVDEVTYMKLFLAKRCSNYTMIDLPYKTDGFGFVFPKGSPLAADLSRAILELNEGGEISRIEEKWFGTKGIRCPDQHSTASDSSDSEKLGLDSFWSLFLIAGVASLSALFIFSSMFVYEHRNVLLDDSSHSLWGRIMNLLKAFDNKDLECHTFRTERVGDLVNLADSNNVQHYSLKEPDVDHDSVPRMPLTPVPLGIHNNITAEEEDTNVASDSHPNCDPGAVHKASTKANVTLVPNIPIDV